MDLESITEELYGLPPSEFTAARDRHVAAARKAKDPALAKQLAALRRPTLAAWASNLLVRSEPDQVDTLLRLGEGLREAQAALAGDQLRELSRQRNVLVGELARAARRLAGAAGNPVGEGVQQEVESTLHAVLADPEAAAEWAAGRLVKPLAADAGFMAGVGAAAGRHLRAVEDLAGDDEDEGDGAEGGGTAERRGTAKGTKKTAGKAAGGKRAVKAAGARAAKATEPRAAKQAETEAEARADRAKAAAARAQAQAQEARAAADEAEAAARAREAEAEDAVSQRDAVTGQLETAEARVADLERDLAAARATAQQARTARDDARRQATAATRAATKARRAADTAATKADKLEAAAR